MQAEVVVQINLSTNLHSFQLDCGAKVTARGMDHMTPLSVAAQKGAADIMALFFKKCMFCLVFTKSHPCA